MTRARDPGKGYVSGQRGKFVKGNSGTHKMTGVNVMRLSEKAVLLELGADVELWIPKSQIVGKVPTALGLQDIEVSEWIAKEKGLLT